MVGGQLFILKNKHQLFSNSPAVPSITSYTTGDYHVEGLLVRLFLPQLQGLDLSCCCSSVQVQRYSVDSRYPLTYGSPWKFGSGADQT